MTRCTALPAFPHGHARDILPIATIGADEKSRHPFKSKIVMKIGNLIPYSNNIDEMVDQWGESISHLTGTEYKPRIKS